MPRHIVCLSYDFDAMSLWIARGLTTPTAISRGEFGAVGAGRILDLLARHGIAATWFIPGVTIGTYPEICRRMVAGGHEVGHHGWTHTAPSKLSRQEEHDGLKRANAAIAELSGRPARGYRSPSWDLSPHSVELLLAEGMVYDSSMMGDDYTPYYARTGDRVVDGEPVHFGPPSALLEMPISWSADDFPHFEFERLGNAINPGLKSAEAVLGNWLDDFRYLRQNLDWGIMTYTFHPFCSGRGHRMIMMDKLIATLKDEGAEFLTMEAAAAAFVARQNS